MLRSNHDDDQLSLRVVVFVLGKILYADNGAVEVPRLGDIQHCEFQVIDALNRWSHRSRTCKVSDLGWFDAETHSLERCCH